MVRDLAATSSALFEHSGCLFLLLVSLASCTTIQAQNVPQVFDNTKTELSVYREIYMASIQKEPVDYDKIDYVITKVMPIDNEYASMLCIKHLLLSQASDPFADTFKSATTTNRYLNYLAVQPNSVEKIILHIESSRLEKIDHNQYCYAAAWCVAYKNAFDKNNIENFISVLSKKHPSYLLNDIKTMAQQIKPSSR